ncbi:MAG TPA: large conductance mechanosensitive channel protein MscL [Firmicutes bacterium]|nr:large conductance mechanosensitive channel protein MscL [Bacillota bacterium]
MKKKIVKKLKKQKGIIHEFREFALRGNVIDLAVGVIIGASFQSIVNSVVNDIIMPVVGIFGNSDFSNKFIMLYNPYEKIAGYTENTVLTLAEAKANGPVLAYGSFITAVINFIIMAVVIFALVKIINKLKNLTIGKLEHANEAAPAAPTTKKCPFCQMEISVNAVKCPHCTSDLAADIIEKAEKHQALSEELVSHSSEDLEHGKDAASSAIGEKLDDEKQQSNGKVCKTEKDKTK